MLSCRVSKLQVQNSRIRSWVQRQRGNTSAGSATIEGLRASESEAAFIIKHDDGSAIVHDVGVGTTWSWPGPDRHEEGEPGEVIVIGVDRLEMIQAAMTRGIDWLLRVATVKQLAGVWIDDSVREVIVAWPSGEAPDLRDALMSRLRASRKHVFLHQSPRTA